MDEEKRAARIAAFDPDNSITTNSGIFGLPFEFDESEIILYPVPWEVTVSSESGTVNGPYRIFKAAPQLDLYDHDFGEVWRKGIHWLGAHVGDIAKLSANLRGISEPYIQALEQGGEPREDVIQHIDNACFQVKETVKSVSKSLLEEGRKIGLVGGDHSTPQGYLEALIDKYEDFGVLQIDAHADLREAYLGFTHSHASIFHNILAYSDRVQLTQLGVRDYSMGEKKRIDSDDRITCFFDADLKREAFDGVTWKTQVEKVIDTLPAKVYVSLDVDGLSPENCPATGTPVPGGFSYEQVAYLLKQLQNSGKEIIGFDLSETGNGTLDGTVSARLLYKLCGLL